MNKGYVYVLSNPALPGLVKIGYSMHSGAARRAQLSNTSVPHSFELVFEVLIPSAFLAEQEIHRRLARYRESEGREFFRVDTASAIWAVIDVFVAYMGLESAFFAEWQDHVNNFAPAIPATPPAPETQQAHAERMAKASVTLAGLRALLD